MIIIARYFGVWGNSKTKRLILEENAKVDDLMNLITHWFNIP